MLCLIRRPRHGRHTGLAINTQLMAELITTIIRSKYQLLTLFVEIDRTKNLGSIGSGSDILVPGALCVINALAWARSATIYSFFSKFLVFSPTMKARSAEPTSEASADFFLHVPVLGKYFLFFVLFPTTIFTFSARILFCCFALL